MPTPPGGPSTINGVLYQMLWSLLRAAKATICSVEQIEKEITGVTLVLEPRDGGDLERFLVETGPQKIDATDSLVRRPAMEILYRIGGDSFTTIANMFIGCDSKYGRRDGLNYGIKRPNEVTFELCAARAVSDVMWSGDNVPLEQNDAATVLASGFKWSSLVPFFEKCWPHVFTTVTEPLENDKAIPDSVCAGVRDRVLSLGVDCPGGLLDILGFSQNRQDIPMLRNLLAQVAPTDEVATPCLLAIERLEDRSEETVPILERFLVGKTAHLARIALTFNGSDAAYSALLRHYESEFDLSLAINLLNRETTAPRAVELTKQYLAREVGLFWTNELETLLINIRDESIRDQLLDVQGIRDSVLSRIFAQEGRSWVGGSKAAAIRAVSIVDPQKATKATISALNDVQAHDREMYPYLLVEIAKTDSITPLLELLGREESKAIQASIARALATLDCSAELRNRLQSGNTESKVCACRAIGYGAQGQALSQELIDLVAHGEDEVAEAAIASLLRLEKLRQVGELSTLLRSCSTDNERWIYLDALLALADPEDEHCKLPKWAYEIWDTLTPYMRKYAVNRLQRKRKELFEKLSKR